MIRLYHVVWLNLRKGDYLNEAFKNRECSLAGRRGKRQAVTGLAKGNIHVVNHLWRPCVKNLRGTLRS